LAEAHPIAGPRLLVLSSLFPSPPRPTAGVFIRERMFRVAAHLPIVVMSPQAWFPGQGLIRILRPGYRPSAPRCEQQQGITIYRPRFLAIPGMLRWLDGFSMGMCCYLTARRLRQQRGVNLIDAHFAYPDGEAAMWLGRWLDLPVTITLRGTEVRHSRQAKLRQRMTKALCAASRVFSVSDSLRQLALSLGVADDKTQVVGNGVDLECFQRMDPHDARQKLGLPLKVPLLISVGALVERKGMHRVIDCLPELLKDHPDLHYVVVGGASPEGDIRAALDAQVARLDLTERVHFLGSLAPNELKWPLSAADVFVLATRNEGWANVFLEAMACGLPVVTTDVGGNAEVVYRAELGSIVPFDDPAALQAALHGALNHTWDRNALRAYAVANGWDDRVTTLVREFYRLVAAHTHSPAYAGKIAGIKS
jgi:teichuronic acid biosynthesis glycosyltransferase TuaC